MVFDEQGNSYDARWGANTLGGPGEVAHGCRLKLLRAVDQNGPEARLVDHRNEDYADQAFLLRPDDEAITLKLTFALQRGRFVQLQVRPQIVDAEAASQGGKQLKGGDSDNGGSPNAVKVTR